MNGRFVGAICAGLAVGATLPAQAAENDELLMYRGADRDQRVLDGARKEGQVTIYTGLVINVALRPMTEAFQKKSPRFRPRFAPTIRSATCWKAPASARWRWRPASCSRFIRR